jgi:hypothetical protein
VSITLKIVALIGWGFQMSTYQQRLTVVLEKRLSILVQDTANLNLQLRQLHRLQDRVRQADRSTRKLRRTDNRNKRRDEVQGQAAF